MIIALGVQLGMHIHAVDCKNAFLNGFIDKEIYIEQPAHFIAPGTTSHTHVCKLKKALYGLKQAPLIWNQVLTDALKDAGFEQMVYEPCIFVKRNNGKVTLKRHFELLDDMESLKKEENFCILGIYVDD